MSIACSPARSAINREVTLALAEDPGRRRNTNLKLVVVGRKTNYLKQQLDGTLIDIRECSCPPIFVTGEFEGSLDCPIDDHRTHWFRWHWAFDDHGKIYEDEAIWPTDRI